MLHAIPLLLAAGLGAQTPVTPPRLALALDSSRGTLDLVFAIGAAPGGAGMPGESGGMDGMDMGGAPGEPHHHGHRQEAARFAWPITGWLRGASLSVAGPSGQPEGSSAIHHVNLIALRRRQLVHDGLQRIWAFGQETAPVLLPASVGLPITLGDTAGLIVAFDPAELVPGSRVSVHLRWSPANLVPQPLSIYAMVVDANFRAGETAAWALPPGLSTRSYEFVAPLSGRVIGAGGHLHDYGVSLRLVELPEGREIAFVQAYRGSTGRIHGVSRQLFGVSGRGRPIRAGRRYRLTVTYENPTGDTIPDGAMGELGLGFAPDDPSAWPAFTASSDGIARELAAFRAAEGAPAILLGEH